MHLMVFPETAFRLLWGTALPIWGMLSLDTLMTTVVSALDECTTLGTGYSFVTLWTRNEIWNFTEGEFSL